MWRCEDLHPGPNSWVLWGVLACWGPSGKEEAADSITVSVLYHIDRCSPAPETTRAASMQTFVEATAIRLIKSWSCPICFLICCFLGPLSHLFPQHPNTPKA